MLRATCERQNHHIASWAAGNLLLIRENMFFVREILAPKTAEERPACLATPYKNEQHSRC